jgi:hypothetical protein
MVRLFSSQPRPLPLLLLLLELLRVVSAVVLMHSLALWLRLITQQRQVNVQTALHFLALPSSCDRNLLILLIIFLLVISHRSCAAEYEDAHPVAPMKFSRGQPGSHPAARRSHAPVKPARRTTKLNSSLACCCGPSDSFRS